MKKWLLFLSSFCIAVTMLYSQSPDFTKLLGENMNCVVDMIPAADGNLIIAGNNKSQTMVFVTSVNTEGEIVWSNFFIGEMLWYSRIVQKSNGNILIPMGNFNPVLLELNNLGDSLGSITLSETTESYFGSVVELQDSLIFAAEIIYNDDPFFPDVDYSYLVKISENGNVIEKYLFNNEIIMDILPYSGNQLFVLVHPYDTIHSYVAKYNVSGELLATSSYNTLNPYLNRLFEINSSSFIAVGYNNIEHANMQGTLSKFGTDLLIEYCNGYDASYFSSATNLSGTENIFVLGQNNDYCIINTVDPFGNITSEYQISDSLTGNTIISKDNYIYVAGDNNYPTNPRACIIKIHRDSISSNINEVEQNIFRVYPNPASDFVYFELDSKYNNQQYLNKYCISIEITDLTGHLIKNLVIENGKSVWDTRNVKSGVYIYKINLPEFSKIGKIIINK